MADIATSDLAPLLRGADAVVHLAWLIQPGHTESITRRVNVAGSERLLHAVAEAGVPALVYASSVGAYSPGPKDRLVDESWPTNGIQSRSIPGTRSRSSVNSTGSNATHPTCGSCGCGPD